MKSLPYTLGIWEKKSKDKAEKLLLNAAYLDWKK
jgi:hypothetical protein